ncbi:MAG: hypothetical protein P4L55_16360 [Syntrophobacteraceae bacterium]|nr:hypothetical protein [Syntrophobacteraceae bacterium]
MRWSAPSFFRVAFILTLSGALLGCGTGPRATRAFYYWRTVFALSHSEKAVLRDHGIERLYLRFFDVAFDPVRGRAVPLALCQFRQQPPPGVAIVPVVFFENAVFERGCDPGALAEKVWKLVREMAGSQSLSFRELQLDCDWSQSTRQSYFQFCRALGSSCRPEGIRLEATIRLHQVKYFRRTGVPPVDRGMLMFYNMGRISANPLRPSIFNVEDAARYTAGLTRYPLPLDGAVAIFSWLIHAGANGRVCGLMEKIDTATLDKSPFLRHISSGRYQVVASAFFQGTYLNRGDTLVVEAMTPDVSRRAASMLADINLPGKHFTLALFDLDQRNLQRYSDRDLESLYSAVERSGAVLSAFARQVFW